MTDVTFSLSQDRLQRLRSSDIDAIRQSIKTTVGLKNIITIFAAYLLGVKNPLAIELDDVYSITLQLKKAGLWSVVQPKDFIGVFHELDNKVISAFCEALDLDPGSIRQIFFSTGEDIGVLQRVHTELLNLREVHEKVSNVGKVTAVESHLFPSERSGLGPHQEGEGTSFPPPVEVSKGRTRGPNRKQPSKSANEE